MEPLFAQVNIHFCASTLPNPTFDLFNPFLVDYRLVPEHAYPALNDDIREASIALVSSDILAKNGMDADLKNFAIFGFSAGGYTGALASRYLASAGLTAKVHVAVCRECRCACNSRLYGLNLITFDTTLAMAKPFSGTRSEAEWSDEAWNHMSNFFACEF